MRALRMVSVLCLSMGSAAWAQESPASALPRMSLDSVPDPEVRPIAPDPAEPVFSIGPAAGYLNAHGADHGTWFGGVQARLHLLKLLAAEASITFHRSEYEGGDVTVTQYPVQLTAFLYLIPDGPVRPYLLGGVGWYYTRVEYDGLFSGFQDNTDHLFGEHLGAGLELMLGPRVSIDTDVRYIFLNPSSEQIKDQDFNYWQVTFGLNLYF